MAWSTRGDMPIPVISHYNFHGHHNEWPMIYPMTPPFLMLKSPFHPHHFSHFRSTTMVHRCSRQDTLVKMGYLKLVQREDERQAAMAGLMTKQLTQPGAAWASNPRGLGEHFFWKPYILGGPNILTCFFFWY